MIKKYLTLLNSFLSNFWFALLLLTISSLLVIFFDPNMAVAFSFGKNGEFASLSLILNRFWVLFLLPLATISIIFSLIIWLKDKTENNYRGFSALIIILLTLGLSFLLISKLVILDYNIKQGTGIFSMPVVSFNESNKPSIIFKYGIGAKNELNTLNNTYTKDMIMDPAVVTNLKLNNQELSNIYNKSIDLKLFDKEDSSAKENIIVTPCSSYYLKINENEVSWNNCHGKVNSKFQQFTDYIIKIIESKEEYKRLPAPKGAYL